MAKSELLDDKDLPDPKMINRYVKRNSVRHEDDQDDIDIFWVDRVTGREMVRWDGGDPANGPARGGYSDRDWLINAGGDPDEEVPIDRCKDPVTSGDVWAWQMQKSLQAERKEEYRRGEELLADYDNSIFTYLGLDAVEFSFRSYAEDEKRIIKPAMEAKGFTMVAFFMGEQDSFGPLSRGIRAVREEKGYVFYYG
jgi:hypothetical protein